MKLFRRHVGIGALVGATAKPEGRCKLVALGPLSLVALVAAVDTLQSTLKWEPVPGVKNCDLIVYTGLPKDPPQVTYGVKERIEKKRTGWFVPGKEAYYREALRGTNHAVTKPLSPDSAYVWSVRTRIRTNSSPWSTYDFRQGNKVVWIYADGVAGNNWWWPFQTPKQERGSGKFPGRTLPRSKNNQNS